MSAQESAASAQKRAETTASKRAERAIATAKPGSGKPSPIPYPGLNYYLPEQSDMFAGRDKEVLDCADALFKSRVLVLHGPTGCGKSSFLRAGVKPRISKLAKHASFAGGADQFEVIRSTGRPLYRFAVHMGEMAKTVQKEIKTHKRSVTYGALKPDVAFAPIAALFSSEEKLTKLGANSSTAYSAYKTLIRAFKIAPILVVDQGEEVFTLNGERGLEDSRSENKEAAAEDALTRELEVDEYFEFLRRVAAEGGGPLIVSLRTEYKGQFDDRIVGTANHPGPWLKGYYLGALEKKALVEAIRRPTLTLAEWTALGDQVKSSAPPKGRNGFRLRFPVEHAEYLADELLQGDAVPPGGVLPALQIACRRIYKQALDASDIKHPEITVRRSSIKRLGDVANQVSEYVSESIEEACGQKGLKYNKKVLTFGQLIDLVHTALASTLVRVEPDGRAVTDHRPGPEFRKAITKHFSTFIADVDLILNFLVERGVLRDKSSDNALGGEETWSLGHDSIALALNKWKLAYARTDGSMRMMMMAAMSDPAAWGIDQLYPKTERPPPVTLVVPRDFQWDRQLPLFAHEKGFDARLNFTIELDATQDATDIGNGPKNWFKLVEGVAKKVNSQGELSLIAAEWAAFPLIIRNEQNDDLAADHPSMKKLPPKSYARKWTDVAATNMNLGNGLIGPESKKISPVGGDERGSTEDRIIALRSGIRAVLEHLVDENVDLTTFDLRAKRLLLFAADLVFEEGRRRDLVKGFIERSNDLARTSYQIRDPIVELIMKQQDLEAAQSQQSGEKLREVFAVAGAFPRAMSAQSGFVVYFGAKDVAALARHEMEARTEAAAGRREPSRYATNIPDLSAATQRITSHTLWQCSSPNAAWDFGADRATVLRLAALAYHTTEYARTQMDELVSFLQRFANGFLERDPTGQDSLRGMRLSRGEIRRSMRECFNFVRFEEYATEVFDLDAPFAYWSDHSQFESKSVAQAIYQELVALRQKTLDHFDRSVGAISWLRYQNAYFPQDDKAVREAFAAKEFAWRHLRIFNFYDSERFMAQAAAKLSRRLDTILADPDLPKWQAAARRAEAAAQ